jgi:chorismate-pyruvate lyase
MSVSSNPGTGTKAVGRVGPAPSIEPAKVVRLMLAFFGDSEVPLARAVEPASVPLPYRSLLAHSGHMTQVLERHHGDTLSVHPYRIRREADIYGRCIDLRIGDQDAPVMTGIMIFNLALVGETVREEILRGESPLGEILIRHRILRQVLPDALLEFDARDPLLARFELAAPRPAYGRLATINCDQRPAVDLLEIVRP